MNRIIPTIGIAVVPQDALAGRQEHVGGDKPTCLGIVVAGLQVVPLGLLVVYVPPVAEGVQRAQCGCQGAGTAERLAPAIICIFYYGVPAAVNDLNHVSLAVAQVIVVGPVVPPRLDLAGGVVTEQQRVVVAVGQAHQDRVVVEVVGGDVVDGLRGPKAVHVVGVAGRADDPRQLLPVPGQLLAQILRGVAHAAIVDDRLPVVAGQLVAPLVLTVIPINDRVDRVGWILG